MMPPALAVSVGPCYRRPMLRRLLVVIGLWVLAGVVATAGCSSSQRRDQNYGSDEGSDYSPEAGVFGESDDAGNDDASDATDPSDATYSPDQPQSAESLTGPNVAQPENASEPDAEITP